MKLYIRSDTYAYSGSIYRFGRIAKDNVELTTKADSISEAHRNFVYQAKRQLHLTPDAGKVEIDADRIRLIDVPKSSILPSPKHCASCGAQLTDSGECPRCDYGEVEP